MHDVIIIGAGIVGCCVARELSKYKLDVLVLESASDVAEGSTKANSGILHAGYDCKPGSLKAKVNVEGNKLFYQLAPKLHFPVAKNGSLVLAFSDQDVEHLHKLYDQGVKNKVEGLAILNRDQVLGMEKNINSTVVAALHAETGGIVSPYEAAIAFAESACINGVKFSLETKVTNIAKEKNCYILQTTTGDFSAKAVVNAAGLYSDEMNNFVSERKYTIIPRKGEYILFDKTDTFQKTLFQTPSKMGKGVLIAPTVHGNLFVGPSSEDIDDKTSKITTAQTLKYMVETAKVVSDKFSMAQVITSFTGLRSNLEGMDDFVVEQAVDGFINCVGINSPGLTSAPAIGVLVREMVCDLFQPEENTEFMDTREPIHLFREMDPQQQNAMIAQNSQYGRIICRCETVTEGDIVDAITRPLGATTVDAVKRRTRAGGGRCQGGFCSLKVMDILSRELQIPQEAVTRFGGHSNIILNSGGDSI